MRGGWSGPSCVLRGPGRRGGRQARKEEEKEKPKEGPRSLPRIRSLGPGPDFRCDGQVGALGGHVPPCSVKYPTCGYSLRTPTKFQEMGDYREPPVQNDYPSRLRRGMSPDIQGVSPEWLPPSLVWGVGGTVPESCDRKGGRDLEVTEPLLRP